MTNEGSSFVSKWRRYRRLPAFERKFVRRAMLLLPVSQVGLRVMGFRRCKRAIELLTSRSDNGRIHGQIHNRTAQLDAAQRISRATYSAELHGLGKPNCLERSLALWWLLRREGFKGELHIGARKSGLRLEAHAWVELGGVVLNDSAEVHQHYARFDAPIAAEVDSDKFKETVSR